EVRDAMLHGLGEGMVAVDEHGRVALANDQARQMLDLPDDCVGRPAGEVLDEALRGLLTARGEGGDKLVLVGEQILFARVDRAVVDGRDVGSVLLLRDRTEVHALVRDLDGARDLTQALRAQAHEFANRLHVVSGLIELGRPDDALAFISQAVGPAATRRYEALPGVTDPAAAALMVAKTATAHERGVEAVTDPDAEAEPGGTPGVPAAERERIFEPGVSTKSGRRTRGIGLTLVRQVVTRRGGTICVEDAPGGGACFVVTLPPPRIAATSRALEAAR